MKTYPVFLNIAYFIVIAAGDRSKKVDTSLITKKDLWSYLSAADKIINHYAQIKQWMDMNTYFGIYIMKVSLGEYLKTPNKGLSPPLRNKLDVMLRKNRYLCQWFDRFIKDESRNTSCETLAAYSLISHNVVWDIKKNFRTGEWKEPAPLNRLDRIYSTWQDYTSKIIDVNTGKKIMLFEKCLQSLASQVPNFKDPSRICQPLDECRFFIRYGEDFGFVMTHKLSVLQTAHYSRGCNVFSREMDEQLMKRFCQVMYAEAHFISQNDAQHRLLDLQFEQICFCGLEGYAEFFIRSWISTILKLQSPSGCIEYKTNKIPNLPKPTEKSAKGEKDIDKELGKCDHTTETAIGVLAVAIKYILATEFKSQGNETEISSGNQSAKNESRQLEKKHNSTVPVNRSGYVGSRQTKSESRQLDNKHNSTVPINRSGYVGSRQIMITK